MKCNHNYTKMLQSLQTTTRTYQKTKNKKDYTPKQQQNPHTYTGMKEVRKEDMQRCFPEAEATTQKQQHSDIFTHKQTNKQTDRQTHTNPHNHTLKVGWNDPLGCLNCNAPNHDMTHSRHSHNEHTHTESHKHVEKEKDNGCNCNVVVYWSYGIAGIKKWCYCGMTWRWVQVRDGNDATMKKVAEEAEMHTTMNELMNE